METSCYAQKQIHKRSILKPYSAITFRFRLDFFLSFCSVFKIWRRFLLSHGNHHHDLLHAVCLMPVAGRLAKPKSVSCPGQDYRPILPVQKDPQFKGVKQGPSEAPSPWRPHNSQHFPSPNNSHTSSNPKPFNVYRPNRVIKELFNHLISSLPSLLDSCHCEVDSVTRSSHFQA